eukprot:14563456-Ditylum_brightwellii.AAC.1
MRRAEPGGSTRQSSWGSCKQQCAQQLIGIEVASSSPVTGAPSKGYPSWRCSGRSTLTPVLQT